MCILSTVPLLEVVSLHARLLLNAGTPLDPPGIWRALVGTLSADPAAASGPDAAAGSRANAGELSVPVPVDPSATPPRPMPMLLRDPLALLFECLLMLQRHPSHVDIRTSLII